MKRITLLIPSLFALSICFSQINNSFPLTDLHIHLKGGFTIEDAVIKSDKEKIRYGIVTNAGPGFQVHNESQIDSVLASFKNYPQFFIGMQAEGREWVNYFSKGSVSKFDYVITDAMTFTDAKGRRNRIWLKNETWIDDETEFMNYLVNIIVNILNTEPIDIYVNPTFLPEQMADRYDYFWNSDRMDRVIKAAKDHNIAIEISNRFRIPSIHFISRARKAGIRFSIGTNNIDDNFTGASYAIEAIEKCRLTRSDFFQPFIKRTDGKH